MTPKSLRSIDVFVISMYINKGLEIFFFSKWKTNLEKFSWESLMCWKYADYFACDKYSAEKFTQNLMRSNTYNTHWGLQIYWFNRKENKKSYICVYFLGMLVCTLTILNEALTVSIFEKSVIYMLIRKKIKVAHLARGKKSCF